MIIKWTVSAHSNRPRRNEYSHETACFYMHARGRGRDQKITSYLRYFDSESEALEYIAQRDQRKAEHYRVDRINRCGVELFDALNKMLDHFEGRIPLELFELAESAINKAKGL